METPPPNTQPRNIVNIPSSTKIETPTLTLNSNMEYEEINSKSYELYHKIHMRQAQTTNPLEEKEQMQKYLNDMRKQIKYLDETNWMFETDQILQMENLVGL